VFVLLKILLLEHLKSVHSIESTSWIAQ
jgi:hypothetical protein